MPEEDFSSLQPEKKAVPKDRIKEIRAWTDLSQEKFSQKYKIPKRTIENWETGKRNPPEYVMYLLERVVKEEFKEKG
ncbi:MAG: helix-turn-helix domain-containing protein [Eubacterium sp.]|nr:helix-turn-helix domain-containing protein [Eubacterium sp.]